MRTKTYKHGSKYEGQMVDGLRWGYGRLSNEDATIMYEGQWQKDKCHGFGKFRDEESEYVGKSSLFL